MKNKKLEEMKKHNSSEGELLFAGGYPHVSEAIFVRNGEFYCRILYADILWLGAYNNYCEIHCSDDKTYCVIHPLVKVEKMLPSESFVRIHRSYIINIHAVDRFIGNMIYIGKQRLDVSRPYRNIFSCFDVLGNCMRTTVRTDISANCTDNPAIPIKK